MNYYREQLEKLQVDGFDSPASIKITNADKNTNWLALNNESANELVNWLRANYNIQEPESESFGGGWCLDDIIHQASEMEDDNGQSYTLTKDQAKVIAEAVEQYHDASIGINWEVIESHIQDYINDNPEEFVLEANEDLQKD